MSRSRARSTSQDSIGLVSEILKEEMFIQHLPPEGGRFHKRLIELFETRGASWFRSYAKWYKERKMKRLGWSPSLFVSASMVEEFDVMKRINSVTTSSRAMKGVQSEAFLKKSREFQASVLKRK